MGSIECRIRHSVPDGNYYDDGSLDTVSERIFHSSLSLIFGKRMSRGSPINVKVREDDADAAAGSPGKSGTGETHGKTGRDHVDDDVREKMSSRSRRKDADEKKSLHSVCLSVDSRSSLIHSLFAYDCVMK